MSTSEVTLDQVLALAQRLRPVDQVRLVARLTPTIERVLGQEESTTPPVSRTPLRGLLADLGPAPSAEDIDEVQREMWATFTRETP